MWRWFVTSVVSESARRSRCESARIARKLSIPSPVFADILIIEVELSPSLPLIVVSMLTCLHSSSETIKFSMLTFLLISETSTLLSKMTSFCELKSTLSMILRTVSHVVSKSLVRSTMPRIIEASEIFLKVLSIPIFSTTSEVSLRPAVSMNLNRTPSIFKVSSIVSRVVP